MMYCWLCSVANKNINVDAAAAYIVASKISNTYLVEVFIALTLLHSTAVTMQRLQ